MARKTARRPRQPSAPPPGAALPQPRRPSGATTAAAGSAVALKSDADYAADYGYVKRDLTRIAVIAAVLFGFILAAPYLLK